MKLVELKKLVEKLGNLMSKKNNTQTLRQAVEGIFVGAKEISEFKRSMTVEMGMCEGKIEKTSIGIKYDSEEYRKTTMSKENKTRVGLFLDGDTLKTNIIVDAECTLFHERKKINIQEFLREEVIFFEKEFKIPVVPVVESTLAAAPTITKEKTQIEKDYEYIKEMEFAPYLEKQYKAIVDCMHKLKERNDLESLVEFNTATLNRSIDECMDNIYDGDSYNCYDIFLDVQELVVKNTLKVLHEVMDLHQQRKEINEDMIFCLQVAKMMYTTEVVDTRILEYIEEICILTKIYKDTKYRTTTYASPDTKNSLNEINNINLDCEDEESLEILQEIGARLGLEIKILDGELIIIDILAQLPGQMTLDDIVIIEDIQVKSKHQQAIDDKEDIVEEIKEMGTLSIKNRVEKLQYFFYGRKVDEIIANKIKTRWVNYIWNTNYMFGTIEESWNYFAADKLATEYKKIEKTNVGCDHFIVGDTLKVHDNKQGFITGVVQEIRSYSMPKNHSYIYAVIDGEEYNNFVEKIDNSNIEMDLKTLSSGTYGSLIRELNYDGDITYEMIDILTEELIKFMKNKSMNFNCWQDVFQEFKIATKVNTEEKINEILEYRVQYFTHQATSKGSGREKVYGESLVNAVTDGKGTITEKEWLTGIQNIINKYEDHQVYKEVCDDVKQLPYIQSYTESQLTRFILERYIYHYKKIKECLVNNSIDVIIKIDEEKEQENMNNNITSVNKLIKNIENYTQKKNKEVKDLTLEERTELAKKSIIDKYNTTTSRNLINTFNKFMEENGHKSEEKIKLTQFETSIGIDGIYTEEELKERIKGLENAQDKFIIWALFKGICGTKAADLLNLKTTDVDLVNNTITYGDKKIIMDDYFKELTIGAMEQIYYKKNNYTGEDVNSTIDYELNSSCPYIIKGKPNVKNNNGMNAFGFEGLRRRLSKLGELTESRFGMDLLGRSGMIWIMQQQQKEWTSSQIKEEIKNRGWKANSNVIYDLMREKYNMEKGNRWKNK